MMMLVVMEIVVAVAAVSAPLPPAPAPPFLHEEVTSFLRKPPRVPVPAAFTH